MKSKEELDTLKEKDENVNNELAELSDEELTQVSGGRIPDFSHGDRKKM